MAEVVLMWSLAKADFSRKLKNWGHSEDGRCGPPRVRDTWVMCNAATGAVYETHGKFDSPDQFSWPGGQVLVTLDADDVIIFEALTGPSEIAIQANYKALSAEKRALVDAAAAAYFGSRDAALAAASSPVVPRGERGYPRAAGAHFRL